MAVLTPDQPSFDCLCPDSTGLPGSSPFWLHTVETALVYGGLTAGALAVLSLMKGGVDSFRPGKTRRKTDMYVAAYAWITAVVLATALVLIMTFFGSTMDAAFAEACGACSNNHLPGDDVAFTIIGADAVMAG